MASNRALRTSRLVQTAAWLGMACLVAVFGPPAAAQDFELRPGYIRGAVQIGAAGQFPLHYANLYAYTSAGEGYNASSRIYDAPYELIVHTPEEGHWDYQVHCTAYTDAGKDQLTFKPQTVPVAAGEENAELLDFHVANPGVIYGKVTVQITGNGYLRYGYVDAYLSSGGAYTKARTSFQSDGQYSFPVQPNQGIQVSGQATIRDVDRVMDRTISFTEYINVAPDGVVAKNWNLSIDLTTHDVDPGTLEGTLELTGAQGVFRHRVQGSGPSYDPDGRPYDERYRFTHYVYTTEPTTSYHEEGLNPGTWIVGATTYFNNGREFLVYPCSAFTDEPLYTQEARRVTVDPNTVVTKNIKADAGWIQGAVALSGVVELSDAESVSPMQAEGVSDTATYGGWAHAQVSADGSYRLTVTSGAWRVHRDRFYFRNLNPDPAEDEDYLNETLQAVNYADYHNPIQVSAGEAVNHDRNYETGQVTVTFRVIVDEGAEPILLRDPSVHGQLRRYGANNQLEFLSTIDAAGPTEETELGVVTFIGFPGVYTLQAFAYIGDSRTEFGNIEVLVEAGVKKRLDLEGPVLVVAEPHADAVVSGETLVVSGTATDDNGIASVTVNGVEATLIPTTPGDWSEVTFSATIPITLGSNTITTVATDTADKTAEDVRNVVRDDAPPTLAWTPTDGSAFDEPGITISGNATDDVGVVSIEVLVDDLSVFTWSGDPAADVPFSQAVTLAEEGDHTIVVRATDAVGKLTEETRTISYITNQPPTVTLDGPYSVDEGASVQVSALASDPDGDPLDYAWDLDDDGLFDDATGPTATFSAADLDGPSAHIIAVRVTDVPGGLSATAQATVTVDNVAPTLGAITAPADPVALGTALNASAEFTDPGIHDFHTAVWDWGDGTTSEIHLAASPVSGSRTYTTSGVYTVVLTVTDDDGGSDSAVFHQYVVVYDPCGGFVTGGGSIQSPEGAYAPDPTLTGKASFGFVSKYKHGATVPTGQTEFHFRAGGFHFHSGDYEWLVVAGAKAKFKGSGTIDGRSGDYGFMLTAIDGKLSGGGGADKFRIKIWDLATDAIVYDNQVGADDDADPTTEITGGNIVIHRD